MPVVLTCGAAEENIHNNRLMARTLAAQGYPASLHEVPDMHNYTAWRDAFEPHLTAPAGARMVSGRHAELCSAAIGANGTVVAYGHYGRPVLAFPAERGNAWEYGDRGMVDALDELLEGGRVKLYCVDSFDGGSWSNASIPLEERAREHDRYESWILDQVVPWIHADCGGPQEIATLGVSLGAYHAVNFALKRADLFPLALGLSGNYDPSTWDAWGERGEAAYFNNPFDYVAHMGGDHLDWLRGRLSLLLVCGQGQWEDTTGALESSKRLAGLLAREGDPPRARPLGARRAARLAVLASTAGPSSATVLLMDETTHLIGLLLGTEEDWPTAFETLVSRLGPIADASGATHRVDDRADHDGAVRPARQAAPRPRRRPARLLVLPPARVAEEGRADGRRVPAQQPVHVPVDGEARGLLRDAAARAEGAADRARPAQEPARQRALRLHRGQVQPAVRPRRDRRRRSATRCS